jgi:fructose-1,6-bisphosphatase
MKKTLLLLTYLLLVIGAETYAQRMFNPYSTKKLVIIAAAVDSSAKDNFCICKIINFSSDNNVQRTDAIFAASSTERPVSKKQLLRNIDYELQQARVFFDDYKVTKQFASAVDCNTLYKTLMERQEVINRSTFLLSSYACR